jgi:hypothetical protein
MLADMRSAPSAPAAGQQQKAKAAPAYMSPDAAGASAPKAAAPARPAPASAAEYKGS